MLNKCILIPLYPAREEPIPGVSSAIIFDKMKLENKYLLEKEACLEKVSNDNNEILLTMGAGDIDRMVKPIVELLKEKWGD